VLLQPDAPRKVAYPFFARAAAQEFRRLAVAPGRHLDPTLLSRMVPRAAPPVLQDESESVRARLQEAHSVQVLPPQELQEQLVSEPWYWQAEPQPQEPRAQEQQPGQPAWVLRELPFRLPVAPRELQA
jgi:hypothetical protein